MSAQAVPAGPAVPSFRSVLIGGAPRFAREGLLPVGAFWVGWKLGGLVAGIAASTVVTLAVIHLEARRGRRGALPWISLAFVLVQAAVGLATESATVYLAQPIVVAAFWGVANLVSAAIGRPLAGVFADAWYAFPPEVKASEPYRRIFGRESIVWGLYLLARSALRIVALLFGGVGLYVIVVASGVPLTFGLVAWSIWYAVRQFRRVVDSA